MSFTERVTGMMEALRSPREEPPDETVLSMDKQLSGVRDVTWFGYGPEKYNKDRKISDYIRMVETDTQVKAALDLIINTLQGQRFFIDPASNSEEDKEVARFCELVIKRMRTPFRRVRKNVLTALPYGYSVGEVIFTYDENFPGGGRIVWDYIKPLDVESLTDCFDIDDKGHVTRVVQNRDTEDEVRIPIEKCFHFAFDMDFDDPYGRSILRQSYDHWFMKRKILKWYTIYLQKLQSPFLHGKTMVPTDATTLNEVLSEVREGRTHVVTSTNDEISVVESSQRGSGFLEAIRWHDMMIHRRMGIPTLIFGQDEASGSYAQSQSHVEVYHQFLEGVQEEEATVYEEHLMNLIDLNFSVEDYPHFYFEPVTDDKIIQLLQTLQPYVAGWNVDADTKWFQSLVSEAVTRNSNVIVGHDEPVTKEQPPEAAKTYTYSYQGKNDKPKPLEPSLTNPMERKSIAEAKNSADNDKLHHIKDFLRERGLIQ